MRRYYVGLLTVLYAGLTVAAQPELPKVPSGEALRKAEKEVQQLFAEELVKTDPIARRQLARTLLAQAEETKDEPASHYVLLRLTGKVAASHGDMSIAMRAIDQIERGFVDSQGDAMRAQVMTTARASCSKPQDFAALAGSYLCLFDEAIEKDDYNQAALWAKEACTVSKASRSKVVIRTAQQAISDIKDLRAAHERAAKARDVIMSDPNNASASLDIGVYLLLKEKDEAAFLMLAKSSSKPVQEALSSESGYGGAAKLALGVADKWIAAARGFKGLVSRTMKTRASRILQNALPQLSGIHQSRVKNRLKELNGSLSLFFPAGEWTMEHSRWGELTLTIHEDGTFKASNNRTGKWRFSDNILTIVWEQLFGALRKERLAKQSQFRFVKADGYWIALTRR